MKVPPPYVSPKERAENRARIRRIIYWVAVTIPVIAMLMAFGYSDQSPVWLKMGTEILDAMLGFPVLRVIAWLAG